MSVRVRGVTLIRDSVYMRDQTNATLLLTDALSFKALDVPHSAEPPDVYCASPADQGATTQP